MRRILIVEDDRLVYEALQAAFLMKGGFEVDYAADGEAGLAALALGDLDLALIDCGLPKLRGLVVAQRALERNIPAVLMTAYGDDVVPPDEHPFPMLAKPFRIPELVARFEQVMAEAKRLNHMLARQVQGAAALGARARTPPESFSEEWIRICERLQTR